MLSVRTRRPLGRVVERMLREAAVIAGVGSVRIADMSYCFMGWESAVGKVLGLMRV
jgi:hypothetical protein